MQSKFVLIQYNVVIIMRHMYCDVQFILNTPKVITKILQAYCEYKLIKKRYKPTFDTIILQKMKGKETHFPVTFKVFDNMIHLV